MAVVNCCLFFLPAYYFVCMLFWLCMNFCSIHFAHVAAFPSN